MVQSILDLIKQVPEYQVMVTIAAVLEVARVQVDVESGTTVTVEFADEKDRTLFLEAVKFVQKGPK